MFTLKEIVQSRILKLSAVLEQYDQEQAVIESVIAKLNAEIAEICTNLSLTYKFSLPPLRSARVDAALKELSLYCTCTISGPKTEEFVFHVAVSKTTGKATFHGEADTSFYSRLVAMLAKEVVTAQLEQGPKQDAATVQVKEEP